MTSGNDNPAGLIIQLARLVRFAHTIFALPFALAGLALATTVVPFRWMVLVWVLVAMVAARSAAMAFNRIVDRHFDAENPRTANREIPAGAVSLTTAWIFTLVSTALFIFAAFMLNPLCGWLSPVAIGVLFFYSLSKRFTWASQLFLGLSLSIAPVGAWLALTGSFDPRIFVLSGAVLCWVAGFDIFYACLDYDFDSKAGLRSVPVRFGKHGGLWIARGLHLITAALIIWLYWLFPLNSLYLIGAIVVVLILAYENYLVRPDDLSKAMLAFNLNGVVSMLFFAAIVAGIM